MNTSNKPPMAIQVPNTYDEFAAQCAKLKTRRAKLRLARLVIIGAIFDYGGDPRKCDWLEIQHGAQDLLNSIEPTDEPTQPGANPNNTP